MKNNTILNTCDDLTIWLDNGQEVKGYYACRRVKPKDVPAGMYKYDIREDDYGDMVSLEPRVIANHYGTFITAAPIDCKSGIKITDWDFTQWSE